MTDGGAVYRILIVEDEVDIAEELSEMLVEELSDLGTLDVRVENDFDEAERLLEIQAFDLVVLDVRDATRRGSATHPNLQGRELHDRIAKTRWVPVVFCTGLAEQVSDLAQPPLIQVVPKNRLDDAVTAVREGLESGVPVLTRHITALVDEHVRGFLRDEIAPNWDRLGAVDRSQIAPVLVHRLAAWLKENAAEALGAALGSSEDRVMGHASTARMYLMPPVTKHVTAADVLKDPKDGWWLVLTPACDLYEDLPSGGIRAAKAEYVRLAKAVPLSEAPLVARWVKAGSPIKGSKERNAALEMFRDNNARYRILPKYLDIPDLMVDFEIVQSVPLAEVRSWTRVATLDSPFAEAMLTSHGHTVARIGTPVVDYENIKQSLGLDGKGKAADQNSVPNPRTTTKDAKKS
ncbi:response regulator [Streptomyces sp. SID8016]|uniref:response regulator n=1 Tax=Streptomyces sp. SID8016 TaxID=2706098 RepID=UPI0013DA6E46|nr:response regulator [Streptomyces sp. SID8016]